MTRKEKWKQKAIDCKNARERIESQIRDLKLDKAILEIRVKCLKDIVESLEYEKKDLF